MHPLVKLGYNVNSLGERISCLSKWSLISSHSILFIMNKAAIVELVQEKIGGTKVQAEMVVDSILDAVVGTLKKGEEVSIAGLGIFSVKMRAARTARNPKTGASVSVPATRVPKFRAAKALKDAVAK